MTQQKWSGAAFVASLIGLATSLLATVMHYNILNKGFEGKSFCALSERFDCDSVMASSYSSLFGIPVAGLALIYYLFAALYVGLAKWVEGGAQARLAFTVILSIPALIVTTVMAGISLQVLEMVCLICSLLYLVSGILFYLLIRALDMKLTDLPRFLKTYFKVAITHAPDLPYRPAILRHGIVAVGLFGIGSLFLFSLSRGASHGVTTAQIERFLQFHGVQPPVALDVSGRPTWGVPPSAPAKITIVEFSDFQCPFCRRAAFLLKPYLGEYRKEVRLVFVNYPLSGACNPQMQSGGGHPYACETARYGICAADQNRFWSFHDLVFERQQRISSERLKIWAVEAGLDPAALQVCLDSPQTTDRLASDVALGAEAQISGTPTLFVNGRRFAAWTEPRVLRALIDAELKRSTLH